MATFNVNQTIDNGKGDTPGTLSYAILQANNLDSNDTIVLDNDVRLTGAMQQLISSNISIVGNNHNLSGDANGDATLNAGDVRPLFILSGTVGISDLTITNGLAQGNIRSGTEIFAGAGGGGTGMGGALFIYDGDVSLNNVTLNNNQALGGGVTGSSYGVVGIGTGIDGSNSSINARDGFGSSGGFGGNGGNGIGGNGTVFNPTGGDGFGGSGGFGGNGGNGKGGNSFSGSSELGGNGIGGDGGFGGNGGSGSGGIIGGNGNGGKGGFGGGGGSGIGSFFLFFGFAGGNAGNGGFGGGGGATVNSLDSDGRGHIGFGGFGGGNGGNGGFGGGGAGLGGAIFIRSGSLNLTNTTLTNNSAIGGTGGTGAGNGQGLGGALFVMKTTLNTNGNNQGMPTTLPTVTSLNTTIYANNTAANDPKTNNIYGPVIGVPTIASARYDVNRGSLVVIGTDFLGLAGANNDIDVSKLTITGEGGPSYTLRSANVDITNDTSFTVALNAADKTILRSIINKKGTQSISGTTYNLAASQGWDAGSAPIVIDADLTNILTAVAEPIFAPAETNPFGLANVGYLSSPTFVDIDGNGTLDVFSGNSARNMLYFKNTGTTIAPAFAAAETNPFDLTKGGYSSFVDINGDGTLDAFVGTRAGNMLFFKNTGTTSTPGFAAAETNPFDLTTVGVSSTPTFVDIDGNGTLDAFSGKSNGDILYFKNTGTTTNPLFAAPVINPFDLTNAGAYSNPTFVDIDGDGKFDALIGNKNGDKLFFTNIGTTTVPAFAAPIVNPFGLTNFGTYSTPSFADINGDGNLDAFVGGFDGDTVFFKNTSLPPTYTTTRTDFNGDNKSDILWRNNDGSVAIWQMNGATVTAANLASTASLHPSWKTAGTGDFNGDGKSDILWRNDNGSVAVWTMNGATVLNSSLTSTPSLDSTWKVTGTGDFNGDGKSDILWRNDNGSIDIWQMNGSPVVASNLTSTPSLASTWKAAGTGDFNGDGKSDILWRNDDGSVALWQMDGFNVSNSSLTSTPSLDPSWKINGNADFNGDGKADILWRNTNTGAIAIWQMNGATVLSSSLTSTSSLDSTWQVTGTGDFNGDGKADILWRKDSGSVVVWEMNGATVLASSLTSVQSLDDANWKVAAPIL
jgi:predicted  nucleic acid-binding Zn ribbon protein